MIVLFLMLMLSPRLLEASLISAKHPIEKSTKLDNHHAAMLGRIEASIMGESALIDRETGRVYWEGGSSNTLYESLAPKFDQLGLEHAQATLLTVLITLAFLGVLAGWIRQIMQEYNVGCAVSESSVGSLLWTVLEWTLLRFPKIENRWLVIASIVLYAIESYNCSTRRFLANAIQSPKEVEEYIENLRMTPPEVIWNVRSFHYELRTFLKVMLLPFRLFSRRNEFDKENSPLASTTRHISPSMFLITKKVLSHQATETYKFQRFVFFPGNKNTVTVHSDKLYSALSQPPVLLQQLSRQYYSWCLETSRSDSK